MAVQIARVAINRRGSTNFFFYLSKSFPTPPFFLFSLIPIPPFPILNNQPSYRFLSHISPPVIFPDLIRCGGVGGRGGPGGGIHKPQGAFNRLSSTPRNIINKHIPLSRWGMRAIGIE